MRLRRVEPVIRRALEGSCRVPRGSRIVVAASGGADSTALLVSLTAIAREHALEIHTAHLNHRLRGAASDADQAFVAGLCARLGVSLHAARWDTIRRMRRRRLAGENGLRILRREFLDATASRIGADFIATAHTADDQLETVLLRLLRGTGLAGLGGMRTRSGRWIKPLLGATRADVESDLRRAGQPWREDASNRDAAFARNRVRHGVVPALLEALDPPRTASRGRRQAGGAARGRAAAPGFARAAKNRSALARRVARLAAELREAESALRRWTRPLTRSAAPSRVSATRAPGGQGSLRIPVVGFERYPIAARRVVLRTLWRGVAPPGVGLTAAHLAQLDRLRAGARGPVRLPAGFTAVRVAGSIRIGRGRIQDGASRGARARSTERPSSLRVPGCTERRDLKVWSRWITARGARGGISEIETSREYFAAEGIRGALEVRQARADETFIPFGRSRPIRIREFLKKLPARSQASPTVLADDSGILWVIGVRRSSRAPVQPNTRKVLYVHAERHD